jgi:DNA-binding transcriptional LysR family regulator
MNIDIGGLQAYVQIAEYGTFHQAADALTISQPALSRRMRKLEQYLGVTLFDRTTRRVSLTAIGRDFLPHARRLIQELELSLSGLRDMSRHGTGQVIVACVPTAAMSLLPDVIKEYSVRYPDNHVRILDDHSSETLQAVLRGEAEFGISVMTNKVPELEFERLFEDPFVLACRRDHPLAKRKQVKWDDLKNYRLITVGRLSGNRSQLDFVPSMIKMRRLWSYEVQRSFWTGLRMVEAGLGVIAVPSLALSNDKASVIVGRPLIVPSICRTIGLITRRGTTLSPAALQFIDLVRKRWTEKKTRRYRRQPLVPAAIAQNP